MKKKFTIFLIIIFLFMYFESYLIAISVKHINVNNLSEKEVYPIGRLIGLKLYTNGVLVVGMSEVEDENGEYYKPYQNSDIEIGDLIKTINGIEVNKVDQLIGILNKSDGSNVMIKYLRNKEDKITSIKPIKSATGDYMLGLWVRDAAAGIGTLTFYDEKNMTFSALGHGIDDVDTGGLLNIINGELVTAKIVSIIKGEKKAPGEIRGTIDEGELIGNISKNTNIGVYGSIINKDYIDRVKLNKVSIGNRNQVKVGRAQILCQLSDNEVGTFEIEIKKLFRNNYRNNKSMLLKITDDELIKKTGGIIPGMSGAPVIQDGKLIGAITNVLLNDPTQGYAIFADMML